MRAFLLLALAGSVWGAAPDAREIVERSLDVHRRNWERLQDFNFLERVHKVDLDKNGDPVKTDIKTFDILFIDGSTYKRLVSRFDKPLSPEEEASERAKLEESVKNRRTETPREREERMKEHEEKQKRIREPLEEVPRAFNFRIVGEERVKGRSVWVIEATPRPGYEPKNMRAKLFVGLKGKLWVDTDTYNWVRAEGELVDDIWFGLFLLHMHEGGRVVVENMPVRDDLWAPERLWLTVSMRIGLFKFLGFEQESTYRDYREFQTDSRILSLQAIPAAGEQR